MDGCQASTPEEEIAIARRALAEGDPKHAMHHLAGALAADPLRPEWLALLDEVIQAGDNDPELAPLTGDRPPFYGTVALHAYILTKRGDLGPGVNLLMQVIQAFPQVPYIDWLVAWLDRPEAAGRLPMGQVAWFLSQMVQQYPGLRDQREGARHTLDRLPDFIRKVRATQPPDARVLGISVSMLRRLGCLDEALEYARAAYELQPSYASAVAIAVAHESRREPDAALEAYRQALTFDPKDVAARLSMADLLWDYNRTQDAEAMYAEALQIEPSQPWALPSHLYLRWWHTGDEGFRFKLLALADACPDNDRARQMAESATPYLGYLPEPSDATTNMMKKVLADTGTINMSSMSVSCLEAPSNYLAFPQLNQMKVDVGDLHKPDPRVPRRSVEHILWRYEGMKPTPAVSAPTPEVASVVEQLARQRYQLNAWCRQARRLGAGLGPQRIPELLATMVHPPMPEGVTRPWGWVYRVQVAAALLIAQTEPAWAGSARRSALLSLVWGPLDWTVDAALVALAAIATEEEETAEDIAGIFREVRSDLPRGGALCYYQALLWSMLRLPTLEAAERANLRRDLRAWYEVEEDEAETQLRVARMFEKKQDDKAALEAVNKALELRPDYPEALELRGQLHLWTGKLEPASADFTRTLELKPDSVLARAFRGEVYRILGRLDDALADLTEAIRLAPEYSFSFVSRGQVYAARGKRAEAIADFSRAIAIRPTAFLHNERAACHYARGEYAQAIADHNEAVRIAPDDPAGNNGLAWILATCPDATLRDGPRAVELAIRACEKTAWKRAGLIDTLAVACAECGNFADAIRYAEQGLALLPPEKRGEYQARLDLYRAGRPFHTPG
jgi:tetratricopeptide (TPR) repeat protein